MRQLIAGTCSALLAAVFATVLATSALAASAPDAVNADANIPTASPPALVVFLVRHGEKRNQRHDPQLSSAGRERARLLADTLRDAGIQHVHSSDYKRTRATATPTANRIGVQLQIYDPRQPAQLVEKLRATGGRHLVVGHSDTTPQLVRLLTGGQATKFDEAAEFDRLYIVSVDSSGSAQSVLLRYGKP